MGLTGVGVLYDWVVGFIMSRPAISWSSSQSSRHLSKSAALHMQSVPQSIPTELGEINLPTLMPDDEQLTEDKRTAKDFIVSLPVHDEGRKLLIEGGGQKPDGDDTGPFQWPVIQ